MSSKIAVHVFDNSCQISFSSPEKQQREMTKFCVYFEPDRYFFPFRWKMFLKCLKKEETLPVHTYFMYNN